MADRLPPPDYGQSLRTPTTDQHQQQNSDSTEISARQRKLWSLFQHTATSLTHLYKCKTKSDQQQHQHQAAAEDQESWIAFQSAAASLTSLYRESADILASVESKHPSSSSERSSTVVTSDLSICNSNTSPMPPPVSSISRNSSSKTGGGEFAKTMPNNCESVFTADALFGPTDHHNHQTSPNQTFDFLTANHHHCPNPGHHGTCRLKRSWSPSRWPDDDMDHLGAKKRRFF